RELQRGHLRLPGRCAGAVSPEGHLRRLAHVDARSVDCRSPVAPDRPPVSQQRRHQPAVRLFPHGRGTRAPPGRRTRPPWGDPGPVGRPGRIPRRVSHARTQRRPHPYPGAAMIRTRSLILAAVVAAAPGCADTNAPLPDPEEVLLVVNSTANTLSIVPVEAPATAVAVPLGGTTPTPVGVSAREAVAVVPLGLDNAVAVVDLRAASVSRVIPLPPNSGATGSTIVDDSIAYVGNPNLNTVSRVNYQTGVTSEVPAGRFPQGLIFTRGKVFVLNGNLDDTFTAAGPSWIT